MTKKNHDLIIIGAGPIGLACGIGAQNKNLDYLMTNMLLNLYK